MNCGVWWPSTAAVTVEPSHLDAVRGDDVWRHRLGLRGEPSTSVQGLSGALEEPHVKDSLRLAGPVGPTVVGAKPSFSGSRCCRGLPGALCLGAALDATLRVPNELQKDALVVHHFCIDG